MKQQELILIAFIALLAFPSGLIFGQRPNGIYYQGNMSKDSRFFVETDRFTKLTTYKPTSAPSFVDVNAVYCSMITKEEEPQFLVFHVHSKGSDWLFLEKVQFLINGSVYEYVPLKSSIDSGINSFGNISVYEYFRDPIITRSNMECIEALANASKAIMRLIGSRSYREKSVSKKQLLSIKQTWKLYHEMGGGLIEKMQNISK